MHSWTLLPSLLVREESYPGESKRCQLHCQLVLLVSNVLLREGKVSGYLFFQEGSSRSISLLENSYSHGSINGFCAGQLGVAGTWCFREFSRNEAYPGAAATDEIIGLCNTGSLRDTVLSAAQAPAIPIPPPDTTAKASTVPAAENFYSTLGPIHSWDHPTHRPTSCSWVFAVHL